MSKAAILVTVDDGRWFELWLDVGDSKPYKLIEGISASMTLSAIKEALVQADHGDIPIAHFQFDHVYECMFCDARADRPMKDECCEKCW